MKIHRTYTIEEIANLFRIHRNTARDWLKRGLRTIDGKRPILVHGADLVAFLRAGRARNKVRCEPEQMYCFRCKAPRTPAEEIADYQPLTAKSGLLSAICSTCESRMYKRLALTTLDDLRRRINIRISQARNT